jgi:hypothetical protein
MRALLIIFAIAVAGHACDTYCKEKLERIATSLERIANLMQNEHNVAVQQRAAIREKLPPKNYDIKVNGRSLKAEPSDFTFEAELTCEEQCKHDHFSKMSIDECVKKNCQE